MSWSSDYNFYSCIYNGILLSVCFLYPNNVTSFHIFYYSPSLITIHWTEFTVYRHYEEKKKKSAEETVDTIGACGECTLKVHYNEVIGMHNWYSKPVFTVIL